MISFLNSVPEYRELTRMEIFKQHLSSYHDSYILLEWNPNTQEGKIVAGLDKRTHKLMKYVNLIAVGEAMVIPVEQKDWVPNGAELIPGVNFIVRVVA